MMPTGRQYLRQSAALPACLTNFAAALQAVRAARASGGGRSEEVLWRQFPLEDGLLYLNAANVCPASRLEPSWDQVG
jgi:hypothetical protein